MIINKSFGEAVEALKEGKRVSRDGWNGKNLFVFMQVPSIISRDIVPNMQSLPQSVKDEFYIRLNGLAVAEGVIKYTDQLALVSPDNTITGWAPSVSDALAEDWIILD